MPANSISVAMAVWLSVHAFGAEGQTPVLDLSLASRPAAAVTVAVDDDAAPSDRGTDDGDQAEPPSSDEQSPSEDGTQEATPLPPYNGCVFDKNDLGLLI